MKMKNGGCLVSRARGYGEITNPVSGKRIIFTN
jgi:hypothetical protein